MTAIERAIAESERQHGGEVRFAAEPALDTGALLAGQTARERAIEVFSLLRLWDTSERNGVLIYLLLADRDIEIVADRGVNAKVASAEQGLKAGRNGEAVVAGIQRVSALLAHHFPRRADDRNELPDRPVRL